MKNHNMFELLARASRHAFGTMSVIAALLSSTVAHADDAAVPVDQVDDHVNNGDALRTDDIPSSWSLNFTPVLLFATDNYRFGGGADPEIRHTLDFGRARLSAGARVGVYYARNLLGVTMMPTLRLTVPVGRMEPYVSFGLGYGWLPRSGHADVATMSRVGIVFRFSESFALGVEGTVQEIERSNFRFPSFGSMVAIDL